MSAPHAALLMAGAPVASGIWNAAASGPGLTLSNGDRTYTRTGASGQVIADTFRDTGKLYFEIVLDTAGSTQLTVGFYPNITPPDGHWPGVPANSFGVICASSTAGQDFYYNGVLAGTGPTAQGLRVDGTVCGFAIDFAAGDIWVARNNTWYTGDPAAGTSPLYASLGSTAVAPGMMGSTGCIATLNTTSSEFTYSPPSGFSDWY